MYRTPYPNELYHHGIKGQKWGVRRYQNPDGTLTAAGKRRYKTFDYTNKTTKSKSESLVSIYNDQLKSHFKDVKRINKEVKKYERKHIAALKKNKQSKEFIDASVNALKSGASGKRYKEQVYDVYGPLNRKEKGTHLIDPNKDRKAYQAVLAGGGLKEYSDTKRWHESEIKRLLKKIEKEMQYIDQYRGGS